MIRALACCICPVVLLFASPTVNGQNSPYVGWGQGQVAELRSYMHDKMSPEDVELDHSIKYRVVDSSVFNAAALKPGGKREIRISSALLAMLDAVNTMFTISFLWNRPACMQSYNKYIANIYNSNTVAVAEGLPMRGMQQPFEFIINNPSICPQLSPSVITDNAREAGDLRTIAIQRSIEWVLLHEFAHHRNEDFTKVSTEEARRREARADSYAFETMLRSPDDTPVLALQLIMLFCSIENFNSDDAQMDHPAGVRRLKALIESARNSEQWKKMWKLASPSQRKQIQAMLDEVDKINE